MSVINFTELRMFAFISTKVSGCLVTAAVGLYFLYTSLSSTYKLQCADLQRLKKAGVFSLFFFFRKVPPSG